METYLPVLRLSPLFRGLEGAQILSVLGCLNARLRTYVKDETILAEGKPVQAFGLVLEGGALVTREDFWGNRNIIAGIGPGEVFAESYACTAGAPLAVSVVARERTAVLHLNAASVLTACASACAHHSALIRNLVGMLAAKNLRMNEKLEHMSQRSTREKLLSFLSAESRRAGRAAFDIPFDRQQLADYLSVDRSAMSAELCRLRDEGVLAFHKNHFDLHGAQAAAPR